MPQRNQLIIIPDALALPRPRGKATVDTAARDRALSKCDPGDRVGHPWICMLFTNRSKRIACPHTAHLQTVQWYLVPMFVNINDVLVLILRHKSSLYLWTYWCFATWDVFPLSKVHIFCHRQKYSSSLHSSCTACLASSHFFSLCSSRQMVRLRVLLCAGSACFELLCVLCAAV